jgi:glycosyltransferase involved in cell wall biosynthesis
MKIGYVSNNPITQDGGIGNFLFKLIYGLTNNSTIQPVFFFKPEHGKKTDSNFTFILDASNISESIALLNTMDVVHWNWGVTEADDDFIMSIFRSITVPIITTVHSLQLVEQEYYQECVSTYFSDKLDSIKPFIQYFDASARNQVEFIERSNVAVFLTNNEKQHADRLGIKTQKSVIIYNSIDSIPIDYANIKQTKHTGIFSRLVYRKGILAAMTVIDSIPETTLTIHGGYGDPFTVAMVDSFLKNPRIQAKGELRGVDNQKQFFSEISLMFGNSLYEPFGYSHVESMQLGVFPIIGAGTGTVELFGEDYPFIVHDDVNDLKQKIMLYYSMTLPQLHDLAKTIQTRFETKSIDLFLSSYKHLYETTCLNEINSL